MREIDIRLVIAEAKLQNPNAGKAEAVAQLFNIRRNHAEVFGDNRQLAERVPNRGKQFPSRRFNPTTIFSGSIASANFPASSETAKVIEPSDINHPQTCPHPLDPPTETIGLHTVPVVKRITPELPGRTEVIRRYSGNNYRPAVLIELELIGIRPNVGRIQRHKDRYVADQFDGALVAVRFEGKPLLEEKKLEEPMCFNLIVELDASTSQSIWLAPGK